MKKKVTMVIVISLFNINILYGDGNNTAIIVSLPKNSVAITAQKERIENNFKIIDSLLAKIQGRIDEIDEVRENIQRLIENQDMEMVCVSISSFEVDVVSLEQEISKISDTKGKIKLEEKIEIYKSLLNEEKATLNNYQCQQEIR